MIAGVNGSEIEDRVLAGRSLTVSGVFCGLLALVIALTGTGDELLHKLRLEGGNKLRDRERHSGSLGLTGVKGLIEVLGDALVVFVSHLFVAAIAIRATSKVKVEALTAGPALLLI